MALFRVLNLQHVRVVPASRPGGVFGPPYLFVQNLRDRLLPVSKPFVAGTREAGGARAFSSQGRVWNKESGNEQRALLAGRGGFRAVYLDPVDAGGSRTGAAAHKVGEADLGYAVQFGIVHARPLGHRFDVE